MTGELYASMSKLLADVVLALDGDWKRYGVTAGQISWLGQCDQLVLTLLAGWPTNSFPNPAAFDPAGQCGYASSGYDLTLTVLRCFPTPDAQGNPPSNGALDQAAQQTAADLQTLTATVPCLLDDQVQLGTIIDYTVAGHNTVGPDGGKIGIDTPYKIELRRG